MKIFLLLHHTGFIYLYLFGLLECLVMLPTLTHEIKNFDSETSQLRISVSQTPLNVFKILRQYDLVRSYQNLMCVLNLFLNKTFRNPCISLEKNVGRNDFSDQLRRKIIIHYKRGGYNINVMRQTSCWAVNSVTVDNFAALGPQI